MKRPFRPIHLSILLHNGGAVHIKCKDFRLKRQRYSQKIERLDVIDPNISFDIPDEEIMGVTWVYCGNPMNCY